MGICRCSRNNYNYPTSCLSLEQEEARELNVQYPQIQGHKHKKSDAGIHGLMVTYLQ